MKKPLYFYIIVRIVRDINEDVMAQYSFVFSLINSLMCTYFHFLSAKIKKQEMVIEKMTDEKFAMVMITSFYSESFSLIRYTLKRNHIFSYPPLIFKSF